MIYHRHTPLTGFELISSDAPPGWKLPEHDGLSPWFLTVDGIVVPPAGPPVDVITYWRKR